MTFEELTAEVKELRHRLVLISQMAGEKMALLKGDATPVSDVWEAAFELRQIKSMADGKMPHSF